MAEIAPNPENQPEKPKKEGWLDKIKNLLRGKKGQTHSTLGSTLGATIPSSEGEVQPPQAENKSYKNPLLNQLAGTGKNNQEILEEIAKMEQEIDKAAAEAGKAADEFKEDLLNAKLEIQAKLGVETDKEAAELLERKELVKTILSGQYFVEREMVQKRLRGKKEYEKSEKDEKKDKIRNDLEKLLGVDNLEFDEKTGLLKSFNAKERAEKLESKSKWYKTISTIAKLGLGIGGATLVTTGLAATMPIWSLGLVFGGSMGLAVRGVTSLVRHLNLSKQNATCRLDIEKLDWQKYGEVFESAKKIERGSFSDAQAVINLATLIKDLEKKSFETNESFKKENIKWKWLDVILGTTVGMSSAIWSIWAAKQEIIQEMMHQGVKFDFDKVNPGHIVKMIKGKFYFLYESATEPQEIARRLGTEKYLYKLEILRGAEFGQHGGHLLNFQEAIPQAFNQEFSNKLREMVTNGLIISSVQIAELIQAYIANKSIDPKVLDKELAKWDKLEKVFSTTDSSLAKKAEAKPKTEEEKLAEEQKKQKEELEKTQAHKTEIGKLYRIKYKNINGQPEYIVKILEKNIDENKIKLEFVDEDIDKKNNNRTYTYQEFESLFVEKWDHPGFDYNEYEIYQNFEGVVKRIEKKINEIKDQGKFVEIDFNASGTITSKGNTINMGNKYEVIKIDAKNNLIIIADKAEAGRVEKKCKLTDLIRYIKTESVSL